MKKILLFVVVLVGYILIPINALSYAKSDENKIVINGVELQTNTKPINVKGRILVPMKTIFGALGAEVTWNEKTETIICTKENTKIILTLGSKLAIVNDRIKLLDEELFTFNENTYIPVRFISECFNMYVSWNQSSKTVIIDKERPISNQPAKKTILPNIPLSTTLTGMRVYFNGKLQKITAEPIAYNNLIYMPIRDISTVLSLKYKYWADYYDINNGLDIAYKNYRKLFFTPNSQCNDISIIIKYGRVYVPIDKFMDVFEKEYNWDKKNKKLLIKNIDYNYTSYEKKIVIQLKKSINFVDSTYGNFGDRMIPGTNLVAIVNKNGNTKLFKSFKSLRLAAKRKFFYELIRSKWNQDTGGFINLVILDSNFHYEVKLCQDDSLGEIQIDDFESKKILLPNKDIPYKVYFNGKYINDTIPIIDYFNLEIGKPVKEFCKINILDFQELLKGCKFSRDDNGCLIINYKERLFRFTSNGSLVEIDGTSVYEGILEQHYVDLYKIITIFNGKCMIDTKNSKINIEIN